MSECYLGNVDINWCEHIDLIELNNQSIIVSENISNMPSMLFIFWQRNFHELDFIIG